MAKVLIPGKMPNDPHKSKPVWVRVLTKMLVDVAARPRVLGPRILIVGLLSVGYVMLGLPYFRWSYTHIGPEENPEYVTCEYVGVQTLQKNGPDCPPVIFRKWGQQA